MHLTDFEKGSIEALFKKGFTMSEIAKDINRDKSTVSRYFKRLTEVKVMRKRGRKPKLSQQSVSLLLSTASSRYISCNGLRTELNLNVTTNTIANYLKRNGNFSYINNCYLFLIFFKL